MFLICYFVAVYFQEDYIAELQEKLKQLRSRISNERELQALASEKEDYNLIRRLQGELGVSIYYNTKIQNTESTDGTGSFE